MRIEVICDGYPGLSFKDHISTVEYSLSSKLIYKSSSLRIKLDDFRLNSAIYDK